MPEVQRRRRQCEMKLDIRRSKTQWASMATAFLQIFGLCLWIGSGRICEGIAGQEEEAALAKAKWYKRECVFRKHQVDVCAWGAREYHGLSHRSSCQPSQRSWHFPDDSCPVSLPPLAYWWHVILKHNSIALLHLGSSPTNYCCKTSYPQTEWLKSTMIYESSGVWAEFSWVVCLLLLLTQLHFR